MANEKVSTINSPPPAEQIMASSHSQVYVGHGSLPQRDPDPLFALIHSVAESEAFFGNLTFTDAKALKAVSGAWRHSHRLRYVLYDLGGYEMTAGRCEFKHGFFPGPCQHTEPPTGDTARDLRYCAKHLEHYGHPSAVCYLHREIWINRTTGRGKFVCEMCAACIRLTRPGKYRKAAFHERDFLNQRVSECSSVQWTGEMFGKGS